MVIVTCLSLLNSIAFKDWHLLQLYQEPVSYFQMQTGVSAHLGLDMIIMVLYPDPLNTGHSNTLG